MIGGKTYMRPWRSDEGSSSFQQASPAETVRLPACWWETHTHSAAPLLPAFTASIFTQLAVLQCAQRARYQGAGTNCKGAELPGHRRYNQVNKSWAQNHFLHDSAW